MVEKLNAKVIKKRLLELIEEASVIEPPLSERLRQIECWIRNLQSGSLTQKKHLMFFLRELIADVEQILILKEFEPEEQEEICRMMELTSTEKYWLTDLFPRWYRSDDPKLEQWKSKLKSGEFQAPDSNFLNLLSQKIESKTGNVLLKYICDLSMATDLIVGSLGQKKICVQITITREELTEQKREEWKKTVRYWQIERAIFISYFPNSQPSKRLQIINDLASLLIERCENAPDSCYIEYNLE